MFAHSRIQLESIVTDGKELFKIIIIIIYQIVSHEKMAKRFVSSFIFMIYVVCLYLGTN